MIARNHLVAQLRLHSACVRSFIIMRGIIFALVLTSSCSNSTDQLPASGSPTRLKPSREPDSPIKWPEFMLSSISRVERQPFNDNQLLWYLLRKDWSIAQIERGTLETIDPAILPTGESTWFVARNSGHISIPLQLTEVAVLPSVLEAVQLLRLVPMTVQLSFVGWEPESAVATIVYDKIKAFRGVPVSRQQVDLPIFTLMVPDHAEDFPGFHLSIDLGAGIAVEIALWVVHRYPIRIDVPRLRIVTGDVRWKEAGDPCVGARVLVYREEDDEYLSRIVGFAVTDRAGAFSVSVPFDDAVLRVLHEDAEIDSSWVEFGTYGAFPPHAPATLRPVPDAHTTIYVKRKRTATR